MYLINGSTKWILVFLVVFSLIFACEAGYANPPGMKAPWPGGVTYQCTQGNHTPPSHDNRFDFYAWDFNLPLGSPVAAAASGTVDLVGDTRTEGYGNRIRIRHSNGSYSLYAHLSTYCVSIGQPIVQGQFIGYSGETGYATGPVLHFSIIDRNGYGLPSRFSDIGIPVTGEHCTSRNYAKTQLYDD